MADVANWVVELCSTVGSGTITLSGSPTGFSRFRDSLSPGKVWYSIEDGINREAGTATFNGIDQLVRDDVRATLVSGVFDENAPSAISLSGNSIIACTFNESAFVDFEDNPSLQVTNLVLLGTLSVAGDTDVKSLIFTTLAGGAIDVGETTVTGNITASGGILALGGGISAAGDITGDAGIFSGAITGLSLDVSGGQIIGGDATIGAITSTGDGSVDGNWSVSGHIDTVNMIASGFLSGNSGEIINNFVVHGDLIVEGIFAGGASPASGVLVLDTSVKTETFVAASGFSYLIDTTGGSFDITCQISPIDGVSRIGYTDYGRTFDSDPPNWTSDEKIEGSDEDYEMNLRGASGVLRYINTVKGWLDMGGMA